MHVSPLKPRLPLMIVIMLTTLGNGIVQAQNPHKPDKSPVVLWSVSVPAGTYYKFPDEWAGPLTHVTLTRSIRLVEIDYDTQQLPYMTDFNGNNGPCRGWIGLWVEPTSSEQGPPQETSLQFSSLIPNPVVQFPNSPLYSGFMATLDLRTKDVVFQAGTKLWLSVLADYPACVLPSSGNVTIQYIVR